MSTDYQVRIKAFIVLFAVAIAAFLLAGLNTATTITTVQNLLALLASGVIVAVLGMTASDETGRPLIWAGSALLAVSAVCSLLVVVL